MLKTQALPVAVLYTIALTIASLVRLSDVPDMGIDYGDKIFHFGAYALLTYLWYLVFRYKVLLKFKKSVTYAIISAIIFGIIIEVLQGTLTKERSLDVFDALANSFGAIVTGIGLLVKRKIAVKN